MNKKTISHRIIEKMIDDITRNYPFFLRSHHLIKLGLYPSLSIMWQSIKYSDNVPFIRVGEKKTIFPRTAIIMWLKEILNNHD